MREIGLQGRAGQVVKTKQGEGGTEGPKVAGARLVAPPFALEVLQLVVNNGCHHFHWRCGGGQSIYASAEK